MLCYCWRPLVNRIKRKCSTESLLGRIFKSVSPMPGTYRRADCFRIRADSGVLWVSVVSDARNGTDLFDTPAACTDTGRIYDTTPARPHQCMALRIPRSIFLMLLSATLASLSAGFLPRKNHNCTKFFHSLLPFYVYRRKNGRQNSLW